MNLSPSNHAWLGPVLKEMPLVLALSLASCGSDDRQATPQPGQEAADAQAQGAPPAKDKAGRDVSALQACNLVKPAEVAKIVGGKLATEPSWTGPNCMYVIELAGGTESYKVSYQDPAMIEAMLQSMAPEEKGEAVAGQWDEAWFRKSAMGEGFSLLALRHGDLAIEIGGERKDPILEIARLAVSRVE